MNKRNPVFWIVILHILFCGAFLACSSDSVSNSSDEEISSSSEESSSGASSSSEKSSSSEVSSSSVSSSSEISSSSETSAKTPEEIAAINAIARSCSRDSSMADSLLDVYEKEGNFGEATTRLADCAYSMSFEQLQGDVIIPSGLYRVQRDLDLNYQDFKTAFYKFWQDDFGVGPCNWDSLNVVTQNKDSLSSAGRYFICTDKREGFNSEINWIRASDLQVNTYKQDCDSSDYREIKNSTTGKMYVCDHGKWRYPMEVEEECGLCGTDNDGLVKAGSIFEYVCDSSQWKLNELIVKDSSDDKEYRATKVAGLYWMRDNMQADTARLYWDEVSAEDFCPSGWRLPTSVEWMSLFKAMNYRASNASVMRLQGGAIGSSVWWTSSESGADSVQVAYVNYHPMSYEAAQRFETFGVNTTTKTYPHSARCVKDDF
ncbi:hypothetical protein [Fibrobacter sp. UBA4309]|uniref:hypothetical protein n=1 Tax=Fibrobacter sp. UBA4309 TaxID=1946537 RepID=UPI0025BC1ADF|nr:hypothetical protein [Fibrobacter sp. UBA4309]